jgi:hypothetical protein
LLHRYLPLP